MTNLRDIRQRLRSVENVKKITDAMERVAAALLRRAQAKAEQSRPYVLKMKEMLEHLASSDASHPLFTQREVKKTALIVISSDKGLTGAYNSNIFSEADKFLKKYQSNQLDLILFGRKAIDYYKSKPWPTVYKRMEWGGKIELEEITQFSKDQVEAFLSGKYDEIWMIYTHYISIMRKKVTLEKFLNIGKLQTEKKTVNYIFEPEPEEIYAELLPRYCLTRFQTALNEAYASELASRIVAMQTASKNSENMIESLTLLKNRLRQESITKEIIEISSTV